MLQLCLVFTLSAVTAAGFIQGFSIAVSTFHSFCYLLTRQPVAGIVSIPSIIESVTCERRQNVSPIYSMWTLQCMSLVLVLLAATLSESTQPSPMALLTVISSRYCFNFKLLTDLHSEIRLPCYQTCRRYIHICTRIQLICSLAKMSLFSYSFWHLIIALIMRTPWPFYIIIHIVIYLTTGPSQSSLASALLAAYFLPLHK